MVQAYPEVSLKKCWLIVAAVCALALSGGVRAGAADPPTARERYLQAIQAMNDLKQPTFVTYRLESKSEGLKASTTAKCALCLTPGKSNSRWTLRHRTLDYETEIITEDHRRVVSNYPGLDPTWYGAYRSLREGAIDTIGSYNVPALRSTSAPIHTGPTPTPDTTLKTVAEVSVLGPAIYNIEDRGHATCPSGDAGYALHLWSRALNPRHQLTDAIIDDRSMRFCMIRLALNAPGAMGGNAVWEMHYGEVDGYWMETDGIVERTMRAFGIKAAHGIWRYQLLDIQFSNGVSPQDFKTPPPVTAFDPAAYYIRNGSLTLVAGG